MSRDTAKGFYDKNPGDPESGYVTPADAQAALDVVYDDMQADVGGADAINAKLGTAPQGSNSTVQERLEQIEAGANLAAQSVTSDKIANGTIVDADINAGAAIAPGKIAGTAVTRSDTGTVTSAMIENETISNSDINAAAAIDKSKIAGVAVTRADVDAIPASMLEDGSITNAKVANNAAIDKAKIAGTAIVSTDSGVVTTGMIADGTIVNGDINPSANIDPAKIAGTAVTQGQSGSVTGPMIANGTISDAQINANAAIGKGKIAGVAVTQADSATVSGPMIANNTITAAQIAANAVGASELADNAVDTAAIADSAVTSAKIADGTIVSGDVAADTFAAFGTVGNLLSANQAIPTLGQWTVAASTESPAGTWTASSTGGFGAYVVITGLTAYATYSAFANISVAGRDATVRLQFRDATDTLIGSSQVSNTIAEGASGVARVTAVAPVGTVSARLYLYCNVNGDAGDVLTYTQAGLWRGAGGVWRLPGVPIVGQGAIKSNDAADLPGGAYSPEGVVTANQGSTFLQTGAAATETGRLTLRKKSGTGATGWLPEGLLADTGWRIVTAWDAAGTVTGDPIPGTALIPRASNAGSIRVRRIGNRVTIRVINLGFNTTDLSTGTANKIWTWVDGWRAGTTLTIPATLMPTAKVVAVRLSVGDAAVEFDYPQTIDATTQYMLTEFSWHTDELWPTSLPGTAA